MSVSLYDHQKDIACQSSLFTLNNKIYSKEFKIEDVGNLIPGSVMVQDIDALTNLYMNNNGCEILKRSKEELNSLGPAYFDMFFPPEEINSIKVQIKKFLLAGDQSAIFSFFQRVRPNESSDYKWYLSNIRLYTPQSSGENLKLVNVAVEVNNISYASKKINSICEQNEFAQKNYFKYISLTKREKEIITLIASGYNSRSISDTLFISLHTVNNHRKNIWGKLSIKTITDLLKFAAAFSLI